MVCGDGGPEFYWLVKGGTIFFSGSKGGRVKERMGFFLKRFLRTISERQKSIKKWWETGKRAAIHGKQPEGDSLTPPPLGYNSRQSQIYSWTQNLDRSKWHLGCIRRSHKSMKYSTRFRGKN